MKSKNIKYDPSLPLTDSSANSFANVEARVNYLDQIVKNDLLGLETNASDLQDQINLKADKAYVDAQDLAINTRIDNHNSGVYSVSMGVLTSDLTFTIPDAYFDTAKDKVLILTSVTNTRKIRHICVKNIFAPKTSQIKKLVIRHICSYADPENGPHIRFDATEVSAHVKIANSSWQSVLTGSTSWILRRFDNTWGSYGSTYWEFGHGDRDGGSSIYGTIAEIDYSNYTISISKFWY